MTIQECLLKSFEKYEEHNAIRIYDEYYTYSRLSALSFDIANTILSVKYSKQPVIIMGSKSFFTHAAICGIVLAGSYYTPVNENFPTERNMGIIKTSNAKTILLDYTDFSRYEELLDGINGYNIICPEHHYEYLHNRFSNHTFFTPGDDKRQYIPVNYDDTVYMLFTSGSTGVPKGIKISHENLFNYCYISKKRNNVDDSSKLLQMHDITFDYSVHNLFLSFLFGACLHIVNKNIKINPFKYLNEHKITHAAFVPSSLLIMKKMRLLKENSLPLLKYICFCGETLPFDNAILIAKSAPNAKLENIYGPTEATVACTYFEFNKDTEELPEYCGSMPIGRAYDGMEVFLADDDLNIINDGIGQIVLSGGQVAKRYVNNEVQTKEKFVKINNKDCYLTGDLGKYVNGELVFLGRNDAQVQIKGYRVELYEIENAVSKIDGVLSVAVIPTPVDGTIYDSTAAFIVSRNKDTDFIKNTLINKLPAYMIPNKFIFLDNMPLNSNGKIERNSLKNMLK